MKDLRFLLLAPGICAITLGLVDVRHIATATPWHDAPDVMVVTALPPLPDVAAAIRHNPFDGAPAPPSTSVQPTKAGEPPSQQPILVPGSPTSAGSVPNPGGDLDVGTTADASAVLASSGDSAAIYVLSTVVGNGRPPLAMLRNGSDTDIVGIGDSIGKRRITNIVSQGIEFSDGSRLAIAAAPAGSSPTPPPSRLQSAPPATSTAPPLGPAPRATSTVKPPLLLNASGAPIIQPSPYQFGPLATPAPGTTPAPVPHYYLPLSANH
jgi:hypothetical protein